MCFKTRVPFNSVFGVLICQFWYLNAANIQSKYSLNGRIVSGDEASLGQFPYQVVLFLNGAQHCGGAILDASHVITAAHCLFQNGVQVKPYEFIVKAGHISLNNEKIQEYPVIKVVSHHKFDSKKYLNDLGILQLGIRFQLENGVLEAIPLERQVVADGTVCNVSGWGIERQNTTDMPENLRFAQVQILNKQICQNMYVNVMKIYDQMLCAADQVNFADACDGDSGGPLVCSHKLVGVVSCGVGCGLPSYPGVYTNIAKYNDWITSVIKYK